MNTHDKITEARLVNGKVFIKQDNGSYEEAVSQTDWARVDALTDEDIARQIAADPDVAPEMTDDDLKRARVVRPYRAPEKAE